MTADRVELVIDGPRVITDLSAAIDATVNGNVARRLTILRQQIELQLPKPKPAEPTGLGAVIEDTRGVRFVRTESALGIRNPWSSALHELTLDEIESLAYDEIDVVRVLSEGVTPC